MTFNLFSSPWCRYLSVLFFPHVLIFLITLFYERTAPTVYTLNFNDLKRTPTQCNKTCRNCLDFLFLTGMKLFRVKICKVQSDLCEIFWETFEFCYTCCSFYDKYYTRIKWVQITNNIVFITENTIVSALLDAPW